MDRGLFSSFIVFRAVSNVTVRTFLGESGVHARSVVDLRLCGVPTPLVPFLQMERGAREAQ